MPDLEINMEASTASSEARVVGRGSEMGKHSKAQFAESSGLPGKTGGECVAKMQRWAPGLDCGFLGHRDQWKGLSKGVTSSDSCFERIHVASEWRTSFRQHQGMHG
jgi:hypothetical protein